MGGMGGQAGVPPTRGVQQRGVGIVVGYRHGQQRALLKHDQQRACLERRVRRRGHTALKKSQCFGVQRPERVGVAEKRSDNGTITRVPMICQHSGGRV